MEIFPTPQEAVMGRRALTRIERVLGGVLLLVVVTDLLLWAGHVAWRARAVRALDPVREQIDGLRLQLREDDLWVERRQRLMQEYAQHQELAQRLAMRGRRAQAYRMLVTTYNQRIEEVYRRFYLVPLPPPEPPVVEIDR